MKTLKVLFIGLLSLSTLWVSAQGKKNNGEHKGHHKKEWKNESGDHRNYNHGNNKNRKANNYVRRDHPNSQVIVYNNQNYYWNKGNFYKKNKRKYVKVYPPVGLAITVLPAGYIDINVGNRGYYYYDGIYYSGVPNNYVVVTPPVGAVVYTLPVGYREVKRDNSVFFEFNGTLYGKTTLGGRVAFRVEQ